MHESLIPNREPDFELVGYLRRWVLAEQPNKQGRIYLHHFVDADEPIFHDHPWDFQSVILSGGYREATPACGRRGWGVTRFEKFVAGSSRFVHADQAHYVSDVMRDTWTLVVTGPVIRPAWGFYDSKGNWHKHDEFPEPRRQYKVIHRNGYEASSVVTAKTTKLPLTRIPNSFCPSQERGLLDE
jgi:hypothetical protein